MRRTHRPDLVQLGRTIRVLRAERGLSQAVLGVDGRLHRNYVGAIERGEINPTFRVLMKVADGLDMPLSEVFARVEALPALPPSRRRARRRSA